MQTSAHVRIDALAPISSGNGLDSYIYSLLHSLSYLFCCSYFIFQLLVMGNEETLGGFPVKQAVPILVCKVVTLFKFLIDCKKPEFQSCKFTPF